jgi:hypothetical protein
VSSALRLNWEPDDLSNVAITWAFGLDIPTTRKFVLVALADHMNDANLSFVGVRKLVAKTSLAERTVQNALSDLLEYQLISTTNRLGGRPGGGAGKATTYQLHLETTSVPRKGVSDDAHDKDASQCKQRCTSLRTSAHLATEKGASGGLHIDNPQEKPLRDNPQGEPSTTAPLRNASGERGFQLGFLESEDKSSSSKPSLPDNGSEVPASPPRSIAPQASTRGAANARRAKPAGETSGFLEFWQMYPRKVARPTTLAAWHKAINGGASPGQIILALRQYPFKADPQYQPHPATWLNGKRWLDEAPTKPPRTEAPFRGGRPSVLDSIYRVMGVQRPDAVSPVHEASRSDDRDRRTIDHDPGDNAYDRN